MGANLHGSHDRVSDGSADGDAADSGTSRSRFGWRVLYVVVAAVVFLLDRITKELVEARMVLGEHIEVFGSVLALHHVRNEGIAFGLLSGAGGIVVLGTVVVGLLLFAFLLRIEPDDRSTVLGGALVTGGAIGNLADRVEHGYVVDFLKLPNWPTFNVADIAIVSGVTLVLVGQWRTARTEAATADGAVATSDERVEPDVGA